MSVRTCRNRRLPAFAGAADDRAPGANLCAPRRTLGTECGSPLLFALRGVGTLLVHAQGDEFVAYGDHALHAAIRQ